MAHIKISLIISYPSGSQLHKSTVYSLPQEALNLEYDTDETKIKAKVKNWIIQTLFP